LIMYLISIVKIPLFPAAISSQVLIFYYFRMITSNAFNFVTFFGL